MLKTFLRWFRPPDFSKDDDKTRSALLLNVILNTFMVALPIFVVAIFLGSNTPRMAQIVKIVAFAWLAIFAARFVMFSGRIVLAGVIAVAMIFSATTLIVYHIGTIRAPAASVYLLAIVTAGLTINRRAIVLTAIASSIAITAFLIAEQNGYLPEPDLSVTVTQGITYIVIFAILSFLLFLAVSSIDESLLRVRQELAERKQTETALFHSTAQLEILHEIDRSLLAARSLREIADEALRSIRRLIPCPRASITLFDLTTRKARFLAANADYPIEFPETPITWEEFGLSVIHTLQQNKPWFTEDVLTSEDVTEIDIRLANQHGIHAWLSLPLLYQGQLIGALNLGRGIGERFSAQDAEIAHDVAIQLAIALQQTNLYNALQAELLERKKLITQLEANNAELERFTYTVSHDLRNPLVTIKGFVGMLEKDLQEGRQDKVKSDLQRISTAADKMHALLSDLLELSRIGRITNPPEDIDLAQVIHEAIETLDARLRSRNVIVHCALDLPVVYGDRVRLREVFENLIDNAAKYMGDQAEPMIEIGTRCEGGETTIFVKDNGLGIEPQFQSRIFGLFDKLNPASEGTGIGLALIKRIIEVQGGRIWVESDGLGKGSTFYFTIPERSREIP